MFRLQSTFAFDFFLSEASFIPSTFVFGLFVVSGQTRTYCRFLLPFIDELVRALFKFFCQFYNFVYFFPPPILRRLRPSKVQVLLYFFQCFSFLQFIDKLVQAPFKFSCQKLTIQVLFSKKFQTSPSP